MPELKNTNKVLPLLFLLLSCVALSSCGDPLDKVRSENDNSGLGDQDNLRMQQGKVLAEQHCQTCHMLPDPSLLDKENWQQALAMMAPRLGIYFHNGKPYPIFTDIDQSFYPDKAAMNSSQWQTIIDYYTELAPSKMPAQSRPKKIETGLPFFSIQFPSPLFFREGNTASFIKIDT